MFAVFAQYGKGLPVFRAKRKTRGEAHEVAARMRANGIDAKVFEIYKIMESAQHDTAPTSRPDSKDAGVAN